MKTTRSLVDVAIALMDAPQARHWGYDLSKRTGVRSGVLYPMLTRLLAEGHLVDGWEDQCEARGRPPRRYYELTDAGREALGALLAKVNKRSQFEASTLGWLA